MISFPINSCLPVVLFDLFALLSRTICPEAAAFIHLRPNDQFGHAWAAIARADGAKPLNLARSLLVCAKGTTEACLGWRLPCPKTITKATRFPLKQAALESLQARLFPNRLSVRLPTGLIDISPRSHPCPPKGQHFRPTRGKKT